MRATAIEFRFRMAINTLIVVLGFWAPWIEHLGIGRRISLLEWLALEFSRSGMTSFTVATPVVILCGSILAALGVLFRVSGAAYLGNTTVLSPQMQAGAVMAAGPYRYVRNPLYIGLWFMVAAMAFVMPPTGALVTLVLLTVFLFRLILGEEVFLASQLGDPYRAYLKAVPRLLPRLRTSLPQSAVHPNWLLAAVSEINPIGIFVTIAGLSWTYDHSLMLKAILITFGASLVVRAFLPPAPASPTATPQP